MIPTRSPLLLEGLKKKKKRWEKAASQLKREAKAAREAGERRFTRYERRVPAPEPSAPDEERQRHAAHLLDVKDRFERQAFSDPKRTARLQQRQAKETRRFAKYQAAEEKKRRKRMLKAPIPTLEPATPMTTVARSVAAKAGQAPERVPDRAARA